MCQALLGPYQRHSPQNVNAPLITVDPYSIPGLDFSGTFMGTDNGWDAVLPGHNNRVCQTSPYIRDQS